MKLIPACNTRTWRTYSNVMLKTTYLEIVHPPPSINFDASVLVRMYPASPIRLTVLCGLICEQWPADLRYSLTFRGPCTVICSYNKTNEMH